jgi:CubicO group peptidase (beta-lactamase class C family)
MSEEKNNLWRISLLGFPSILLFLSVFSAAGNAQDIETKVDDYIKAHIKSGNFSGSILIAYGNEMLVCKGYGMANIEHGILNTPKTKFRIGSITKQFTAMAIMQLQQKGFLSTEDPLTKFLPDYPDGDKITIHHLLTHTSGVVNFTSLPELEDFKILKLPVKRTIELFKNKPLDFEPGTSYRYSNSGYILLGYIIENVSKKSYAECLKENIFNPLNMKDSGYDSHSEIQKDRAAGYVLDRDGLVNADYIDMSIPHGAGALYSTVEDLYRWDRALYTEKLVKNDSLKKIFTPFKENYGYGWLISKKFKRECFGHGGGIEGFKANISRYPESNTCIIVLSNFEHAPVSNISQDLAAILFGERYELPEKSLGSKTILLAYCPLFLSNLPFILASSCVIIPMWRKRNIYKLR